VQLARLAPWEFAAKTGSDPGQTLTYSNGPRSHAAGVCELGMWKLAAMRNRRLTQ
jgi:hypothetical protein